MTLDIFARLELDLDPDWHRAAACNGADPAAWFPEGEKWPDMRREAVEVCSWCPVRAQCLNEAMRLEKGCGRDRRFGIYGGLTAIERVQLEHEWGMERTGPGGPRGEDSGRAVLTAELVREARRMRREGAKLAEIARHIGVSEAQARRVVLGLAWAHIKDEGDAA